MPTSPWRILHHEPADGPWNMAVDEAIVRAVGQARVPPTLRFYAWRAPTVSLGFLQRSPGGVDLPACKRMGIALVRRPTGGRAVLHAQELTYSVCVPLQGSWRALSVRDAFGLVSLGLVAGLGRLGISAAAGESGSETVERERAAVCFLVRRMPAILVGGRKLIGSAQRRFQTALLQHGSILLEFDPALHQAVFPSWPRRNPTAGITHLRALLGTLPPIPRLVGEMAAGWEEAFNVSCLPGTLTATEESDASRLCEERYGTPAWTFQR